MEGSSGKVIPESSESCVETRKTGGSKISAVKIERKKKDKPGILTFYSLLSRKEFSVSKKEFRYKKYYQIIKDERAILNCFNKLKGGQYDYSQFAGTTL